VFFHKNVTFLAKKHSFFRSPYLLKKGLFCPPARGHFSQKTRKNNFRREFKYFQNQGFFWKNTKFEQKKTKKSRFFHFFLKKHKNNTRANRPNLTFGNFGKFRVFSCFFLNPAWYTQKVAFFWPKNRIFLLFLEKKVFFVTFCVYQAGFRKNTFFFHLPMGFLKIKSSWKTGPPFFRCSKNTRRTGFSHFLDLQAVKNGLFHRLYT